VHVARHHTCSNPRGKLGQTEGWVHMGGIVCWHGSCSSDAASTRSNWHVA
jgi:hypothetical protein